MHITGAVEKESAAGEVVNVGELLSEGQIRISACNEGDAIIVPSLQKNQEIPSYEGVLEVNKNDRGFYLINEVDLETYLKYVVPSEMPADYPLEALKAQAVCAKRMLSVRWRKDDWKNIMLMWMIPFLFRYIIIFPVSP